MISRQKIDTTTTRKEFIYRPYQGKRTSNHTRAPITMTLTTSSKRWELTPLPLLIRMLGYLDNATLMLMCLVCKQIRDLIWDGHGLEQKLIRVFELHPSAQFDSSTRFQQFIANMDRHFHDPTKRRLLPQYREWNFVTHGVETSNFNDGFDSYESTCWDADEMKQLTRNMSMPGILSVTTSSPVRVLLPYPLLFTVFRMVPNLQQLDLSNVDTHSSILEIIAEFCPQIEKIKWNFSEHDEREYDEDDEDYRKKDSRMDFFVYANGCWLRKMENLKEFYFDNGKIRFVDDVDEEYDDEIDNNNDDINDDFVTNYDAMSDLDDHPDIVLFGTVRNLPLERLSIRNLRCDGSTYVLDRYGYVTLRSTISQNMLIKFVRNAPPTLVWFRSDLSATNIQMLQSERPGIEFVS